MAMRPCLVSDSSKNCLSGNMLGKVSKASPLPSSYKPMGSQTSPLAFKAVLAGAACCTGAKADAEAIRARELARANFIVAVVFVLE